MAFVPRQVGLRERAATLLHLRPGARYTVRVAALNGVSGPAAAAGATYAQVTVSTGPGGKVFRIPRAPLSRPPRASPQPATTPNKLLSLVLHKNPRPRRPPPRSAPLPKARPEGLKMLMTLCLRATEVTSFQRVCGSQCPLLFPDLGANFCPTLSSAVPRKKRWKILQSFAPSVQKFQWEAESYLLISYLRKRDAVCVPWPLQGFYCLTLFPGPGKEQGNTEGRRVGSIEFTGQHVTVPFGSLEFR